MPEQHIGKIVSLSEPADKNEKKYVKIVIEPNKWTYNINFSESLKTKARELNGEAVVADWEQDGQFRKLTDLTKAPEGTTIPDGPKSFQSLSPDERQIEADRVTARAIAVAAIRSNMSWQGDIAKVLDPIYEWAVSKARVAPEPTEAPAQPETLAAKAEAPTPAETLPATIEARAWANPPKSADFSAFWAKLNEMGIDKDKAFSMLNCKSITEWLETNKHLDLTLMDALEEIMRKDGDVPF